MGPMDHVARHSAPADGTGACPCQHDSTVLVIKGLIGHMRPNEVKNLLTSPIQADRPALFKDILHLSEWENPVTGSRNGTLVGMPVPQPDDLNFSRVPASFRISTPLGPRTVTLILGCFHCPYGGNHRQQDHRTFIQTLPRTVDSSMFLQDIHSDRGQQSPPCPAMCFYFPLPPQLPTHTPAFLLPFPKHSCPWLYTQPPTLSSCRSRWPARFQSSQALPHKHHAAVLRAPQSRGMVLHAAALCKADCPRLAANMRAGSHWSSAPICKQGARSLHPHPGHLWSAFQLGCVGPNHDNLCRSGTPPARHPDLGTARLYPGFVWPLTLGVAPALL